MGILDAPVSNVVPKITGIDPPLVGGVSTSSHPTILGTAHPLSSVTLYANGAVVGQGFADAAGDWAIALPAQLNGTYNLVARVTPASDVSALVILDPKQPLENASGVPAVFELDNLRGLYYTNGVSYGDLTSLAGAVGGTLSGVALSCGGYVDPAAVNILSNGTFDTATTGWSPGGSATLAIVSGEMQMTIVAAADSFSQAVTGYNGRALRFTGTGRRGTVAVNLPAMATTLQNGVFGGNASQGPQVGVSNTPATLFTSASPSGSAWFGVKAGSGTGTCLWDNFSVVEAMPLQGWTPFAASSAAAAPAFSVLIDAVAPASLPAAGQVKVIWQADANSQFNGTISATQHNAIRLLWTEDGTIHLVKRLNNVTSFDITLGTVAAGTRFRVAFAASPGVNGDTNSGYAGSVNGGNSVIQATPVNTLVGVSHMRIGQDANGTSSWDGTYNRVAVVRGRQLNDWLEYQATLPAATPRVWAGDSYINGAGGVVLPNIYETATGQISYNIGVGGTTFAQIATSIMSRPYLRDLPLIVWDGSNNGMVDVASQVAIAQQIWDWKANGRILWIPSLAVPNPGTASNPAPSAQATLLRQYRDALIAAFGTAHVYDEVPTLQSLSTGSADDLNDLSAGLAPRSILITQNPGEVHLGSAAMTAITNDSTFRAKINAL